MTDESACGGDCGNCKHATFTDVWVQCDLPVTEGQDEAVWGKRQRKCLREYLRRPRLRGRGAVTSA